MQATYAGQTIASAREGSGLNISEGSTPDSYVPDGGLLTLYAATATQPTNISFTVRRAVLTWLEVFEAVFAPADLPLGGMLSCAGSGQTRTLNLATLQQAESSHDGCTVTTSYDFTGTILT
jgi:hypothetical protein